jgi:uncharacterized protein (UPF0216 family)
MKELEQKSQIQKEIQKPVSYEKKIITSLRKIKGLSLYELNLKTNEVKKVETKTKAKVVGDTYKLKEEVVYNSDCIYIQALNLKNAKRKFKIKTK